MGTRLVFVFRWTMDGIKRWDVRVSNAAYRSYAEGPEWWKLVVRGISFSVDGAMWYPIPLFVGLLRVGIMGFFPAFVTPTFFTDPPHVHTSVWALNADFWGHVALMATVGAIAELSLKVCFARDRPAVNSKTVYFPGESHSFPSGHTLRSHPRSLLCLPRPARKHGLARIPPSPCLSRLGRSCCRLARLPRPPLSHRRHRRLCHRLFHRIRPRTPSPQRLTPPRPPITPRPHGARR